MILVSHHRSKALALRKLKALKKANPSKIVKLYGRFNASGERSKRGQEFRWSIVPKRKPRREFVVHFDYGSSADGTNLIRFQVHVFGPATSSDARAIQAIREIEKGETPKGWKVEQIFWGHPFTEEEDVNNEDEIKNGNPKLERVRRAAIRAGEATVARKNSVRPNRR